VKRIWDLLSELSSRKRTTDAGKLLQSRPPALPDFDRRNAVNGDQLKSAWEGQESMQAASSGQYSRYANCIIDFVATSTHPLFAYVATSTHPLFA
jgi:hypothetical protein